MKVLHLPYTYYPDPPGGTEIYVAALVRHLAAMGISGTIAAPSPRATDEAYEILGHRVYRFPVPPPRNLDGMYGEGSAPAAAAVRRLIDAEAPDVVHMHAFTRGISALIAREARSAGVPVVFTYHTPTVSCQRGTLLRYGKIPCDGKVLVTRCSACIAQQHGARGASWSLALIPPFVGRIVGRLHLVGRGWAAVRLTDLLWRRKRAFAELMQSAAVVVAVSDWVRDLLLRNGVADERIVESRQGTDAQRLTSELRARRPDSLVRAVMLGRLDGAKGLDVLLESLAMVPDLPLQLHVYGVEQGEDDAVALRLRTLAASDPRVSLLAPFDSRDAAKVIGRYDVTLVPSQVLETGPLVILESFAAGVPVVGSRLGGIAERVRDGIDGLLVTAGDRAEWAATLERVVQDPALLSRLASAANVPRTMRDVAEEMRDVYRRVTSTAPGGAPFAHATNEPS